MMTGSLMVLTMMIATQNEDTGNDGDAGNDESTDNDDDHFTKAGPFFNTHGLISSESVLSKPTTIH